jgi:PLP dependent protein
MAVNKEKYKEIIAELEGKATLVAVSKTKPVEDIQSLYDLGQRHFGENYVQELIDKQSQLPADIRWHFIGHLQSNKVKQIAPFVYLIHGVDSLKLLQEINKQAAKLNRIINVLQQVYIAKEETKFGLDEKELETILNKDQMAPLNNICVAGLMGMASFTDDREAIEKEFNYLTSLFDKYGKYPIPHSQFLFLSMGMSSDYKIALNHGSNMVRIGSLLFGERNYSN